MFEKPFMMFLTMMCGLCDERDEIYALEIKETRPPNPGQLKSRILVKVRQVECCSQQPALKRSRYTQETLRGHTVYCTALCKTRVI